MPLVFKNKFFFAILFLASLFTLVGNYSSVSAQESCSAGVVKKVVGCQWVSLSGTSRCPGGTDCSCQQVYSGYYQCNASTCSVTIDNRICAVDANGNCSLRTGSPATKVISCSGGSGGTGGGCDYTFQYDCRKTIAAGGPGCNTGGWDGEASGSDCRSVGKQCGTGEACCKKRICLVTPSPTRSITPTPTTVLQYCQDIRAYNTSWVRLTAEQMAQLRPGTRVNFCSAGRPLTSGSYNAVRYQINGTWTAASTLRRTGSTADWCYAYTIPTGVRSFNLVGQLRLNTGVWVY